MESGDYLDFGSDTDSDGDRMEDLKIDSDEDEEREDIRLLKMLFTKSTNPVPKKVRDVDDFEAEMEAELDKRALEIEALGGLSHQKSLSRSSSNSSLNRKSPSPCSSPKPGSSKRVRFDTSPKPPQSSNSPGAKKKLKGIMSKEPKPQEQTEKQETSVSEGDADSNANADDEAGTTNKPKNYDPIYFDSDESEGEDDDAKTKKNKKRSFMSNDELFYDPEADSKDQAWVDNQRREYSEPTSTSFPNSPGVRRLPNSDAILNCPACFTVLCLDCQRHDFYTNQYRAMFVKNCSIVKDTTLTVPLKQPKGKGRKRKNKNEEKDNLNPGNLSGGDEFNPVRCKICTTQVAVYDSDEVFHFFNVLASHA